MKLDIKIYPYKFYRFLLLYVAIVLLGFLELLFLFDRIIESFPWFIVIILMGFVLLIFLFKLYMSHPLIFGNDSIKFNFMDQPKMTRSTFREVSFVDIETISEKTFNKPQYIHQFIEFQLKNGTSLYLVSQPFSDKQKRQIIDMIREKIDFINHSQPRESGLTSD